MADQSCLYMLPCKHLLSICFQLMLCMTTATACAAMTLRVTCAALAPPSCESSCNNGIYHSSICQAAPASVFALALHHGSCGLPGHFAEAEGGQAAALQELAAAADRLLVHSRHDEPILLAVPLLGAEEPWVGLNVLAAARRVIDDGGTFLRDCWRSWDARPPLRYCQVARTASTQHVLPPAAG